ncbi:MAG: CAP domain-containing protein [Actinomycetota bacterium]
MTLRLTSRALGPAVLTCALLLVVLGVGIGRAGADPASDEARFVQLINDLRTGEGLAPLTINGELRDGARAWTKQMADADTLSHSPDMGAGLSVQWTVLGENVGRHGGHDVDALFAAFVASPAHYQNLIDPRFGHVGVGVVTGPDGTLWTTHRFMATAATPVTAQAPPPTPAPTSPPTTSQPEPPTPEQPVAPTPTSTPTSVPVEPTTTSPPTTASPSTTAAPTTSPTAGPDLNEQAPTPPTPNEDPAPLADRATDVGPSEPDVVTVEAVLLELVAAGI